MLAWAWLLWDGLRGKRKRFVKDVGRLGIMLQLGWTVALAVLIPLGLGLWLDNQFSASPLFILIGAMLGIITATVGVVRVTARTIDGLSERKQTPTGDVDRKEDEE
jgi:F0F1-type ATP synthase assembly protein I